MNKFTIGQRIGVLRVRMGMSTLQLAACINRSQATVSRIENGKQGLSLELLVRIAKHLNVHPFELLADVALRHSRLFPEPPEVPGAAPRRMLANIIETSRLRAGLSLEIASQKLEMAPEELQAIEFGYALPEAYVLRAMTQLYTADLSESYAYDNDQSNSLANPRIMQEMERVLSRLHTGLAMDPPHISSIEMDRLRSIMSACFGLSDHLLLAQDLPPISDTLLKALDDPEFRQKCEELALTWSEHPNIIGSHTYSPSN